MVQTPAHLVRHRVSMLHLSGLGRGGFKGLHRGLEKNTGGTRQKADLAARIQMFYEVLWFLFDDFQCWNMQKLVQHELSWRIWNPVFFLASDVLHHTLIVILGQPIVVKPQEHSEASSSSTWASASYRMTVPLAARGTKAHYPHACPGIMRSQITTEDPQLDNSWKNQRSPCSASSWIMNHSTYHVYIIFGEVSWITN